MDLLPLVLVPVNQSGDTVAPFVPPSEESQDPAVFQTLVESNDIPASVVPGTVVTGEASEGEILTSEEGESFDQLLIPLFVQVLPFPSNFVSQNSEEVSGTGSQAGSSDSSQINGLSPSGNPESEPGESSNGVIPGPFQFLKTESNLVAMGATEDLDSPAVPTASPKPDSFPLPEGLSLQTPGWNAANSAVRIEAQPALVKELEETGEHSQIIPLSGDLSEQSSETTFRFKTGRSETGASVSEIKIFEQNLTPQASSLNGEDVAESADAQGLPQDASLAINEATTPESVVPEEIPTSRMTSIHTSRDETKRSAQSQSGSDPEAVAVSPAIVLPATAEQSVNRQGGSTEGNTASRTNTDPPVIQQPAEANANLERNLQTAQDVRSESKVPLAPVGLVMTSGQFQIRTDFPTVKSEPEAESGLEPTIPSDVISSAVESLGNPWNRPIPVVAASIASTEVVGGILRFEPETPLVSQVTAGVSAALGEQRHMRVELQPEELGRVRIDVTRHEGSLTAAIEVERPATGHLMAESLSQLHDSLQVAGIQIDRIEISVAPQTPPGETLNSASQRGQGESRGDSAQSESNSRQPPPEQQPRRREFQREERGGLVANRGRGRIRDLDIKV